jgi:hypothetical protein
MSAAVLGERFSVLSPLHQCQPNCKPIFVHQQVDFLLSMATALPIQMHMEPQVLGESGGPPLFRRAEAMIRTIPELDFLIS